MGPAPVFIFIYVFTLFSFLVFRQFTPRDASLCCVCLPHSLFDLISAPFPSSFIFVSLCGALVVLVLVFLSGLSFTAYMITFLALRVLYVVILCLFCSFFVCLFSFCLSFVSWFSLLNPFLATMSFAGYLHARFILSAAFPVCYILFCFVLFCFSPTVFVLVFLVQLPLSCDHSWIRSGPVNNVR